MVFCIIHHSFSKGGFIVLLSIASTEIPAKPVLLHQNNLAETETMAVYTAPHILLRLDFSFPNNY